MKKEKKFKNRICAGLLALILSGSPMSLVKGEEQIVKSEQTIELEQKMENWEKLIRHPHLHKYVSEDGVDFKWICSEEPIVDGLNWTEETKTFDFSFEKENYADSLEKYECPVEQYHQHLYLSLPYGEYRASKDSFALNLEIVTDEDIEWAKNNIWGFKDLTKLPVIMTYPEQEYEMMKKLKLWPTMFRCINIDTIKWLIKAGNNNFKLLELSVKDEGEYYIVDEKLMSVDELIQNSADYPYVPSDELSFSDTYQPESGYKVYKKSK